jgi:hypothetical protein
VKTYYLKKSAAFARLLGMESKLSVKLALVDDSLLCCTRINGVVLRRTKLAGDGVAFFENDGVSFEEP